jgi:hypothetical protein
VDFERGALARLAFDFDPTTVILDDSLQMGSPSLIPLLFLAVKNGWKIFGRSVSAMPDPVSITVITAIGAVLSDCVSFCIHH